MTMPLAETQQPDTADLPDRRRITEHDPAFARIKARTVRLLTASIRALVRDLRPQSGVQQLEAQSVFIQRHISILRAAYRAAHREGQLDYYANVSREPQRWVRARTLEPDEQTLNRRMAFYAPSVARMAHEAVLAANAANHTVQASESITYDAQGHSEQSVSLADDMAVKHTGVMVAFMLKPAAAKALVQPGGEPAEDLHITLAFLGDSSEMDQAQRQRLVQAVASYAATAKPLRGNISGIGRFNPSASSEGKVPVIALLNVPGIQAWRAGLVEALGQAGTPADATFEYTPHITLDYVDEDDPLHQIKIPNVALRLDRVTVAIGDQHHTFAIGKPQTLTFKLAGGGGIGEREDNLASWQANVGARLVLQADLTWSGGQDGYVAAGFGDSANPYQSLWWDLEPTAQHCATCPMFAAGSPYDPPWTQGGNILNATPGDGNTECGAGCKCSLRYGGGSVPALDMKRWVPPGAPDLPAGPMAPVPPPPPARGGSGSAVSPAIPGGTFTDGQKRALDLYRLAEDRWNQVRGDLPELPNFFTLANPHFEPMRLPPWETLTRQQQRALQQAFEAYAVWQANVPQAWLEFFDEFEG